MTNGTGGVIIASDDDDNDYAATDVMEATFTLTNDDAKPKFAFSTPSSSEDEGTEEEDIVVIVEDTGGDVGLEVVVAWGLTNGSTADADSIT